jgi:hypothetical protein
MTTTAPPAIPTTRYTVLGDAPLIIDTSRPLNEVLSAYIATFTPIAPAVDGRIGDCSVNPGALLCPQNLPVSALPVKQSSTRVRQGRGAGVAQTHLMRGHRNWDLSAATCADPPMPNCTPPRW